MKKVKFKNSRNKTLIGNLHTADSKSIIIMAHGFTDDKSAWDKFNKTPETLNKLGYNVLAFDFSGCGQSDDDTLTISKQVDDLNSAIGFAKTKGYEKISLLGHSLGGLISLKCYKKNISTMVLWAPVTDKIKYKWEDKLTNEEKMELQNKGYVTKIRKDKIRKKILVDKKILGERENIKQKEILNGITCPILIIHGNNDKRIPYTDSKNAVKLLTKESKLKIINNADHHFDGHINSLLKSTTAWFLKYFKK